MNVSKINSYTPNFGQVTKRAAKHRIDRAKFDVEVNRHCGYQLVPELMRIYSLVKREKDNQDFDVDCVGETDTGYRYGAVHAGTETEFYNWET